MPREAQPWLLPSGFEDILPARAERLEALRRGLLDLYRSWGYRQVIPPMLEHLESLLTGSGQDLDLQTIKLVDQASGRLLGFRSDMTPQMARIDAQRHQDGLPNRLCYAGTVLRAMPDHYGGSRAPFQVGAELFGVAEAEADLEVTALMVESLLHGGVRDILLDLGHVSIFRVITDNLDLPAWAWDDLYAAMQRKSWEDLQEPLNVCACPGETLDALAKLLHFHGGREQLGPARAHFRGHPAIEAAFAQLEYLWDGLLARFPDLTIRFDLAELHGHRYHTGLLFFAYGGGQGAPLATGGRYDGIGTAFGKGRPATGFSLDLKSLVPVQVPEASNRVWAPRGTSPDLLEAIHALRAQGYRVVQALHAAPSPVAEELAGLGCRHFLALEQDRWVLRNSQAPTDGQDSQQ